MIYFDSPVFVSIMVLRLLCLKMKVDELLLNLDNNRVSKVLLVNYCKAFDVAQFSLVEIRLMALPTEHIIGVSLISLVDVSWSALMARNRLWRV